MSTIIIQPDCKENEWDKIIGVGYSIMERDYDKERFVGHILMTNEMWTMGQLKETEEFIKEHIVKND